MFSGWKVPSVSLLLVLFISLSFFLSFSHTFSLSLSFFYLSLSFFLSLSPALFFLFMILLSRSKFSLVSNSCLSLFFFFIKLLLSFSSFPPFPSIHSKVYQHSDHTKWSQFQRSTFYDGRIFFSDRSNRLRFKVLQNIFLLSLFFHFKDLLNSF